jgi:hypothetical protein
MFPGPRMTCNLALSVKIGSANEGMRIDSVKEGAGRVVVMSGNVSTGGEICRETEICINLYSLNISKYKIIV